MKSWESNYRKLMSGTLQGAATLESPVSPLVVTLTSFPLRYPRLLPLTLHSLMCQSVAFDRVVLWIADTQWDDSLLKHPWGDRLEIRRCRDSGSHKRVVAARDLFRDSWVAVADDDLYYHPMWLYNLVRGARADQVVAYRMRHIEVTKDGSLASYKGWTTTSPETYTVSPLNMPTLGHGTLFPPGALHEDAYDVDKCLSLCPIRSDFWTYWMFRRNGLEAVKCRFPYKRVQWPGSKEGSISSKGGAKSNMVQLANLTKAYGCAWRKDYQ